MDVREIRASGLLEQYVMGTCSRQEIEIVEQALIDFPDLKNDLYQIGAALELYTDSYKIDPSPALKDKILSEARDGTKPPQSTTTPPSSNSSVYPPWLTALLALGCLGLLYLYITANQNHKTLQDQYDRDRIICDSIQTASDLQFALISDLQNPNNEFLALTPTPKYSETDLTLIYNDDEEINYLQVGNLPSITAQQSYQLWSLKPGINPIPLTVFQGDEGIFIPIDFEDGTATYAITIEQFGGVQSPTLDDLIGTVNVPA